MMADGRAQLQAAHSGVYGTSTADPRLREAAAASRCAWIEIDLVAVRDKAGLLQACATALAFPSTFGANWDALADCLQDLSWRRDRGYVISIRNAGSLSRRLPSDWTTALEILATSANHWKTREKPFIVLVDGVSGLPELVR